MTTMQNLFLRITVNLGIGDPLSDHAYTFGCSRYFS